MGCAACAACAAYSAFMTDVFLNGAFLGRDEARVSALDAAVQHGVGLFETMLGGVREGGGGANSAWVFRLGDHLARLKQSALDLGLSDSLREDRLGDAVLETIGRAAADGSVAGSPRRVRVRLTLTAGDLNMLAATGKSGVTPTVLVVVQPATQYPEPMFERGTRAVIADTRANPLNPFESHKTINYWWRLSQLQAAARRGAAEAVVLQVSNHLGGGCVSNIFLVKDGVLFTPIARGEEVKGGLPSPVLPGITRGAITDFAAERGMECRRQMLSVQEMLDADEVFLTNSSWGVLPVVAVAGLGDERVIGEGKPGEVTRGLRAAWLEDVAGEERGD